MNWGKPRFAIQGAVFLNIPFPEPTARRNQRRRPAVSIHPPPQTGPGMSPRALQR